MRRQDKVGYNPTGAVPRGECPAMGCTYQMKTEAARPQILNAGISVRTDTVHPLRPRVRKTPPHLPGEVVFARLTFPPHRPDAVSRLPGATVMRPRLRRPRAAADVREPRLAAARRWHRSV